MGMYILLLLITSLRLQCAETQRDITCTTRDGFVLQGIALERAEAQRAIVICHGLGSHARGVMRHFSKIFPHDTLYAFDFRYHGRNRGFFSVPPKVCATLGCKEAEDVHAAVSCIREMEKTPRPLCAIGISMGGAALMKAVADGACVDAMVIDSSFADLTSVLQRFLCEQWRLPVKIAVLVRIVKEWLCGMRVSDVDIAKYGHAISVPTLVLHDEQDALIPLEQAQKIVDSIPSARPLCPVTGTTHAKICVQKPEIYRLVVNDFFGECVRKLNA